MPIGLYMDVNISQAIAEQLRRRGVDVLRAQEDHAGTLPDPDLLERASQLGRILFTHDIRFRVLAEDWQRQGRPFVGLVFGHSLRVTIGKFVADLELIALASEPTEWISRVDYLPY
jgi:hypothetical protein